MGPTNRFFHLSMAGVSAALLLVAIACLRFFGYELSWLDIKDTLLLLIPFVLAASCCWYVKADKLLQSSVLILWTALLSSLLRFPIYIADRSPVALQDAMLARIDHWMGLDIPLVLASVAHHPHIAALLNLSYKALIPMITAAVFLPALTWKFKAAKEYLVATIVSIVLGGALFAIVPAIGPWATYHFPPSVAQQQCQQFLLYLHSDTFHIIKISQTAGVICFPSFHVVFAVLAAVALWSIRPLRIPAMALAILITVSTVTTGWHYVIDVIGGLALAAISIVAAKAFSYVEAHAS